MISQIVDLPILPSVNVAVIAGRIFYCINILCIQVIVIYIVSFLIDISTVCVRLKSNCLSILFSNSFFHLTCIAPDIIIWKMGYMKYW